MNNIKAAAKILRYAGLPAKADLLSGVVLVKGITQEEAAKASKAVNVEVVAV